MNKIKLLFFIFLGLVIPVFFVCLPIGTVFAATNIDSTNKYAWSNNIGWINFGCTNCNAMVSDTAITGYAWSTDFGWINLNPANGGVHNTTSGVLSGYAWGTNCGWINFSGVTINTSTGVFSGTATGDVVGSVNFSCTETGCPVTTTWRPTSQSCGDGTCNGTETCSNCSTDCGNCPPGCTHYRTNCNAQKQCELECNSGENLCSVNDDCATHNICNSENKCEEVNGPGSNLCLVIGSDCTVKHTKCNNLLCELVNGSGINQCSVNADCPKHNECNAQKQCIVVDGIGNNVCLIDDDCNITHTECNLNSQCITVAGVGLNQCVSNDNCQLTKHNECTLEDKCVVVDGAGIDQCQTNSDCQPKRHNECNAQKQCVIVNGDAPDQCQADGDCQLNHNECNNGQCVAVVGEGINQCASNNDCIGSKHNECNAEKQCVVVNGAGSNKCQTNNDCEIQIFTHTQCNEQKQCISVSGSGINECTNSNDCKTETHTECNLRNQCIVVDGKGTNKCQVDKDCNIVKNIVLPIKKIIDSPQGLVVTKTVSTTGILVTAIASIGYFPLLDLFLILSRLFNFLLVLFGLKKKSPPWGVVYDSVTKRPLDPAYVVLKNIQGKQISSAITDLDGRYGFLVEPGIYKMEASKTNYVFPSQKLTGKIEDEVYSDLYFGENIEVKKLGDVIIKNIPLDPVKFDWNEFAKKKKKLMIFYSKWDAIIRKTYDFIFVLGFIFAMVSYVFSPYPYNAVILTLYLIFLLFRILGLKPRTYGYIADKTTGNPMSFAIIRVLLPDSNVQVASKTTDKYGKYYCLVPTGKYYIKIEKKNEDGSYSLVYTSAVMDVSKEGIIKEKFRV